MAVKIHNSIKRKIIYAYVITITVMGIGTMFALQNSWSVYSSIEKMELVHKAAMASAYTKVNLMKAYDLLRLVKQNIDKKPPGILSKEEMHLVLKNSSDDFNIHSSDYKFGLLSYADLSGNIYAQNTGPLSAEEVTRVDKLYAEEYIGTKNQPVFVGEHDKASESALEHFHLVMPIRNERHGINGFISVEIPYVDLNEILLKTLSLNKTELLTFRDDGYMVYSYPATSLKDSDGSKVKGFNFIKKYIIDAAQQSGELVDHLGGDDASQPSYIAFVKLPDFGLNTVAILSRADILYSFVKLNTYLLIYVAIAFTLVSALFARLIIQARELDEANYVTLTDPLTELNNRRALDQVFTSLWRDSEREGKPISALFIDIDHFKDFNDRYGHEFGDVALREVAGAIRTCLHRPLDVLCRWGGEEFVMVLPDTNLEGAIFIANHILETVRGLSLSHATHVNVKISVSIGIATAQVTEANITDDLVDMADKAMYKAKEGGRDRYVIYGDDSLASKVRLI